MRIFGGTRYANVTSSLALVVALGGTSAYAATSIRSADIKNGQVKGVDLAVNAVTSGKVRNGSLLVKDFKAGQLPGGATGAAGKAGANGATGADGKAGANGATGGVGPKGAEGAAGAPGVGGPAGPAGPSASSFTETDDSYPLNYLSVGTLGVVVDDITIAVRSRIAASSTVMLQPTSPGDATFQAACRIEISSTSLQNITPISRTRSTRTVSSGGVAESELTLHGFVTREPGTYRLVTRCYSNSIARAQVDGASLLAIATADAG
jgi:hypothetical protein